jgi:hypothetical protein
MAATPLFDWMCLESNDQSSQREQSRRIHPGTRRFQDNRSCHLVARERFGPRCGDKDPRTIRQLDIELRFAQLAVIGSEYFHNLATEWMIRMRDPHELLWLTSYCGSSLLVLLRRSGIGYAMKSRPTLAWEVRTRSARRWGISSAG